MAVRHCTRTVRGGLALLLILVATAAAADFREPYRLGLEAIEREDWAEAVRQMDRAILQRPEASGLLEAPLLRRYTPHFYRGQALAQLGACREALPSLDEAERQGRVGRDEAAQLQQLRRKCEQRIATVEQTTGLAQHEIDRAASTAAAVALIESSPLMAAEWKRGNPSFSDRQQLALAQLAEARSKLAEADRRLDAESVADAGVLGQRARAALELLGREAGARRDELRAEVERLLGETRELAAAAQKDLRFVTSYLEPFPPALAGIRNRLETTVESAEDAGATSSPQELEALKERLELELRQLRRAVQAPPAHLQEAVSALLAAEYDRALEVLAASDRARDPRVRAHACLLRAAAHHALYRAGSGGNSELLEAARADLADCARHGLKVSPHPKVFSPAFLAFFQHETLTRPPPP